MCSLAFSHYVDDSIFACVMVAANITYSIVIFSHHKVDNVGEAKSVQKPIFEASLVKDRSRKPDWAIALVRPALVVCDYQVRLDR